MQRRHVMPFGAEARSDGSMRFRLWAPGASQVELELDPPHPTPRTNMTVLADAAQAGWFEAVVASTPAGTRYAYRIDGRLSVPDPAARCNPDDLHGRSIVVDPQAFEWRDAGWRGRPWEECVIYEVHIGTFTPTGSFAAAIDRLDHVSALGVTALEVMPVADLPGRRNWGYDGVLPFAPDGAYGTPDEFKRLIEAAHARGLMVSLNEVGSDPKLFGLTVAAFHGASADRAQRWPHTMLATSTHDNKRAEDVRARIDVLSEMPGAWRLLLRRCSRTNRACKRMVNRELAPSRDDGYLLYQTLLGTFPLTPVDDAALADYRTRITAYMVKAVREAKMYSSWTSVNAAYEDAATEFLAKALGERQGNLFLDSLSAQAARLACFGMLNSLSMTLLKLVSPDVPDIYQGTEIWDLSLVDPDNRREVDYALRRRLLEDLVARAARDAPLEIAREVVATLADGRAKLWLIWRLLALRRSEPALFEKGDYLALKASGVRAQHVVAFGRQHADSGLIAVAGRLWASLGLEPGPSQSDDSAWGDTAIDVATLPLAPLVNVLTGEALTVRNGQLSVSELFANFPGAVIVYSIAQ